MKIWIWKQKSEVSLQLHLPSSVMLPWNKTSLSHLTTDMFTNNCLFFCPSLGYVLAYHINYRIIATIVRRICFFFISPNVFIILAWIIGHLVEKNVVMCVTNLAESIHRVLLLKIQGGLANCRIGLKSRAQKLVIGLWKYSTALGENTEKAHDYN